jgi:hypothetical protein
MDDIAPKHLLEGYRMGGREGDGLITDFTSIAI